MSPLVESAAEVRTHYRRNLLIAVGGLALLALAWWGFKVWIHSPQVPLASNLAVFALFNLNLIVFLLLVLLLFRNLVKLAFERRQKVLGARFKAKLVVAFLSLALTPAILIFIIASNFINTSIEGWFKPQVERPLDQALDVAQTYYQGQEAMALRHARYMADVLAREGFMAPAQRAVLGTYLNGQQERLGLAAITVFNRAGLPVIHAKDPALASVPTRSVNKEQLRRGLSGQEVTTVHELDDGDMIQAIVPIKSSDRAPVGALVVGTYVPQRLETRLRGISQSFQEYKQLRLLKQPLKGIYILLFLLMTLVIVFSATWFGLYLARGITEPVQMLAEGTRAVAAGNLNYKVQVRADDELGVLVDSFNRMTSDLALSQTRLEHTYRDLQAKHEEVEQRRRYTETVLDAVATGVLSLDAAGRITTVNGAAERMLGVSATDALGQPSTAVLRPPVHSELAALIQRMNRLRENALEREVHLRREGHSATLLASATALKGPDGAYLGMVLVFDDLTELLKAQRLAAWREVAQRIAHEIKNPLTPIQLSAQRLRRRLGRHDADEQQLVTECTETIIHEVDGLRRLVDEFSRFARMPAFVPKPTDVRPLIDSVANLYRDSHPGLSLVTHHAADLPLLEVDPDHIKRAVLNLVDNAVSAVGGTGEVAVETLHLADVGRVRIVVSDSGPGIPLEDRDKLFLPHFSTKVTGMGLGLPIVSEIATEHGGTVTIEDNEPRGSRFVIDLPVARTPATVEA